MPSFRNIFGLLRESNLQVANRLERAVAEGRVKEFQLRNIREIKPKTEALSDNISGAAKIENTVSETAEEKAKELSDSLSTALSRFSGSRIEKSTRIIEQIDDLTYKFNLCEDTFVSEEAQKIMTEATSNPNVSRRELTKAINKAEHLLDTANTAKGSYSPLFSDKLPTGYINPLSKSIAEYTSKSLEKLRGGKIKNNIETINYSNPRKSYALNNRFVSEKGFADFEKFDSLSRYIARYKDNPKLLTHMYQEQYLSKLDSETAKFLKSIDSEFGIKIFISKPLSKSEKLFIQEELKSFKDVGLTDFPPILEINNFDPELIANGFDGIALVTNKLETGHYIKLRNCDNLDKGVMRHEFIHNFDPNLRSLGRRIVGLTKKAEISPEEVAEMRASGLNSQYIKYAGTETADLVAVAGQLGATHYSEAFSKRLVELGLPKEVLQMKPVSLEKPLYQSFTKTEDLKLLDELKLIYGGKIPTELQMHLIDNPKHIKRVRNLLNLNCSTNAKKVIQEDLLWYVRGINSATLKNQELIKLLDLQAKGGYPAYDLYDLQEVLRNGPETLAAFKKWANVRTTEGDRFIGHVFIGCKNKEQIKAAERLLNISVNGEFPYQLHGQHYAIQDLIHRIPPEKLDKVCTIIEKDAQNGNIRNLQEYIERYWSLRKHLEDAQSSIGAKIFGSAPTRKKAFNS